jgi:hypothetical protein
MPVFDIGHEMRSTVCSDEAKVAMFGSGRSFETDPTSQLTGDIQSQTVANDHRGMMYEKPDNAPNRYLKTDCIVHE